MAPSPMGGGGANVHVEYDFFDQGAGRDLCPRRFCFVGTIRIMPNSEGRSLS